MSEQNEESAEPKPQKSKMWIPIAVLTLVVAGDVGFRVMEYLKPPRPAGAASNETDKKGKSESEEPAQGAREVNSVAGLDPFLVNLADTDSACYLKATFQLGLEEKAEKEGGGIKDPIILAALRDAVISLLSSKTSTEILTIEGKDKLRQEVRARLKTVVPKLKIQEVYIVDFVVSS